MAAHRNQVHARAKDGDIEPGKGLHGVAVHERGRGTLAHERHDRSERLAHARLVVDEHHRDEPHVLVEDLGERGEVDDPPIIDGDRPASSRPAGLEHGRVLDGTAEHGAIATTGGLAGDAEDGEIVGFGAPAREHEPAGARAQQPRELLAGVVEGPLRETGDGMAPRRVSVAVGEEREHRRDRLGAHRCRRGVVEVGDLGVGSAAHRAKLSRSGRRADGRRRPAKTPVPGTRGRSPRS